ncbi:hypothetical protein SAMN06298226_2307 [Nitrosovibrio sp. Nv4]|nr:hypothetical protein SAMN06298226_2307 [Nitrosovibrio sp. Nv4]
MKTGKFVAIFYLVGLLAAMITSASAADIEAAPQMQQSEAIQK